MLLTVSLSIRTESGSKSSTGNSVVAVHSMVRNVLLLKHVSKLMEISLLCLSLKGNSGRLSANMVIKHGNAAVVPFNTKLQWITMVSNMKITILFFK